MNTIAEAISKLTSSNTFGHLFITVNKIATNISALSTGDWEKNKGTITLTGNDDTGFTCNTNVLVKKTLTINADGDLRVLHDATIANTLHLNSSDVPIKADKGECQIYDLNASNTANVKILKANTGYVSNTIIFTNTNETSNIIYSEKGIVTVQKINTSNTINTVDLNASNVTTVGETLKLFGSGDVIIAEKGTCRVNDIISNNVTANNITSNSANTKILYATNIGANNLTPNTNYAIDVNGIVNANNYYRDGVSFLSSDQKYDSITFEKSGNTKGIFFANSTANVGIINDGTQLKIIDKDKSNSNVVIFHTLTQKDSSGYIMTANGGIKVLGNVDLNISSPKITTKDSTLILPTNISINATISNKYNLDVNGNINATDIFLNGDSLKSNVNTNILTANSVFIGKNNTATVIITANANVANINMTATSSGINYANTRIYEDGHDIVFKDLKSANTIKLNANTQTINAYPILNISNDVNVAGKVNAAGIMVNGKDLDTSSTEGSRVFGSLLLNDTAIVNLNDVKGLKLKYNDKISNAIGYASGASVLSIFDMTNTETGDKSTGNPPKRLISLYQQSAATGSLPEYPALEVHGDFKTNSVRFKDSDTSPNLDIKLYSVSDSLSSSLVFRNILPSDSSNQNDLIKLSPKSTYQVSFPSSDVDITKGKLNVGAMGSVFTSDCTIKTSGSGLSTTKSITIDTTSNPIINFNTGSLTANIKYNGENVIISTKKVGINNESPAYDLDVTGNVHATKFISSSANVDNFYGSTIFNNDVLFKTKANTSALDVTGQASFMGDSSFSKATFNGIITATNAISTFGTANVTTLNVLGTSNTALANVTTLNVSGVSTLASSTFNGTITATSAISTFGTATVTTLNATTANVTYINIDTTSTNISPSLYIKGNTTFASSSNYYTNIQNKLNVTGDSSLFTGALTANGVNVFNGSLTANGVNVFNGAVTFNKPVTVNSSVVTTGSITLHDKLNFNSQNTSSVSTGTTDGDVSTKMIQLTDNNNILTISGGTGWNTTGAIISLFGSAIDNTTGYNQTGKGSVSILGSNTETSKLHIEGFPRGVLINKVGWYQSATTLSGGTYDNISATLDVNGVINAKDYYIEGKPFTASANTTIGTTKILFNGGTVSSLANLNSISLTKLTSPLKGSSASEFAISVGADGTSIYLYVANSESIYKLPLTKVL